MHRVCTHYIADICQAAGCQARPCRGRQTNVNMTLRSATALLQHGTPFLSPLKTSSLISDIAIFVLKRDVKLQLTNSRYFVTVHSFHFIFCCNIEARWTCVAICSDMWSMGCVLYELMTLKHAVFLIMLFSLFTFIFYFQFAEDRVALHNIKMWTFML